jgi:hypothetical protein
MRQQRLEASHRNQAWCDRFGARWHFAYGGWVRTPKHAEASVFGLTPTEQFGPFAVAQ